MTHRDAVSLLDHSALRGFTRMPMPLPGHPPLHWADLGCGAGTFTVALADYLPAGSTIDAIDLTPGIKKQTTPAGIHIQPMAADFTLPNPALNRLDGILMANSLHYVNDKPAFLKTLHAALKPGGLLALVEYDTDTPVARWVPFPVSFTTATRLLTPPHWQTPQKGNTHPSAFGRSRLYAAFAIRK
ncbi:class I SAM-dependent methyltransferase [Puia sp.]|jgi:ubiquinone/menaquinone biosynthesis C-methylase UbiE|uniref:class I SAM-dependent methyltransferase n=1 Tax=Puia sp. TaxID=2045100 RepID=UPI002F3EB019